MNPLIVRRTVRASALYDLIVTAAFALPFTAPALFDLLGLLHVSVGGAGEVPSAHSVFTVMFANLMGSLVVVWSIYRLTRPTREAGIADTAGRVLFSLGMIAALLRGASPWCGSCSAPSSHGCSSRGSSFSPLGARRRRSN